MLVHERPCFAVGVRNMDKRFLVGIEYIGNGCQIVALEEAISYAEAFQPLVAVELLIIIVVDGWLKHCLILRAHNRNGVATEV